MGMCAREMVYQPALTDYKRALDPDGLKGQSSPR